MILESFFICNKSTFCKPMRWKFIVFLTWITCLLLTRSLFFLRNDLALSIASSSSAISVSSLLNGNEKQAILQWFLDDLIKVFIFPSTLYKLYKPFDPKAWTSGFNFAKMDSCSMKDLQTFQKKRLFLN